MVVQQVGQVYIIMVVLLDIQEMEHQLTTDQLLLD
jgi:hypothetical protein